MEAETLRSERIVLDISRNEVLLDGAPVPLRGKPLRLLQEFMSHPGELLSKAHFNDRVWDGRPHSDAVLTTAIKELRSALGDDSRAPWAIETVHGKGYRFLPEVVSDGRTDPGIETARGSGRVWIASLIAAVLVLGVALFLLLPRDTAAPIESIAVLPFDDLSRSGDWGWFAHGVTEELLNSLVRIEGLAVAARTSVTRLVDRGATIEEIGRALRVSHVMEGSIRTGNGGNLRVTAQLIRVDDGFHVWSSTWDRNASSSSSLAIQRDVAELVHALMEPTAELQGPTLPVSPTLSDGAWEKLMRGRELVERRSRDSVVAGLGLLHEVNSAFPDSADTLAALASASIFAGEAGVMTPQSAIADASRYAERAMALASDNVPAILAASLVAMVNQDAQRSLQLADRAVDLSPGLAEAHRRRGVALTALGDMEAALPAFHTAVLLDPLSDISLLHFAQASFRLGRFNEAYEAAAENLRWNPQSHLATAFMGELSLQTGDYERALACLRSSAGNSPDHGVSASLLGELFWRLGLFRQLQGFRELAPVAYAAGLISQGHTREAISLVETIERDGIIGLTVLDVLLWAGQYEDALPWAEQVLARLGRLERIDGTGSLPDDVLPAYRVLRQQNHPSVDGLSTVLSKRYATLTPDSAETFNELFSGLSWHAARGNVGQSLQWLSAAQQRGLVLPELRIDPVFEDLRRQPQAVSVLALMDQRAASLRAGLEAAVDC